MLITYLTPEFASPSPRGPKDTACFIAINTYQEREIPKGAGFRWDPLLLLRGEGRSGHWWTDDVTVAARLIDFADESCMHLLGEQAERLRRSRRVSTDATFPAPEGLEYLPFQRAGIEYALERPSALVADEMGLGKTIQAIGVLNATPGVKLALVVCPASLKLNWRRELRKWLVDPDLTVGVASTRHVPPANVIVANYEAVVKHQAYLKSIEWDVLIVDEAHYIKTAKSNRSKAVRKLKAKRTIALTGTPIVNRPKELHPIVAWLDPEHWGNWLRFNSRYNTTAPHRLAELQRNLRDTVMIRRMKSDVLTELPPKRRQVIEFEPTTAQQRALIAQERFAFEQAVGHSIDAGITDADFRKAFGNLASDGTGGLSIGDISRMRHDTAVAKVETVVEHVLGVLDEVPKVILFAHHRDVLEALYQGTKSYGATLLTGDTPLDERQRQVDSFQHNPEHRVFVASLLAAGVGLTLTASNHVVFAELDWVPGNLKQAEDRAHRIGSEGHESISVQYLVLEGSLDAYIAQTVAEKISVIEAALDREGKTARANRVRDEAQEARERQVVAVARSEAAAPAKEPPRYAGLAAGVAQYEALRTCVVMLSGLDPDRAGILNGQGWSAFDGPFGHSLAEQKAPWTERQALAARKLVAKYRRQIPPALYALAVNGEMPERTPA